MVMAIIQIDQVSKHYGSVAALSDLSLDIKPGIFGLLVSNGAGKTTLLRLLLGLLTADGGTIEVLGMDPVTHGQQIRSRVGVLLEHHGFYQRLTGLENLRFFGQARGLTSQALTQEIQKIRELFLDPKMLERP